jgi:hypothetical protein
MNKKTLTTIVSVITILFIYSAIANAFTSYEWENAHNHFRYKHADTPRVYWSWDLFDKAQDWADSCNYYHENDGVNENIARNSSPYPSAVAMVQQWYNEIDQYDYSDHGYSEETAHFAQVVWVGTTHIGCGIKSCGQFVHYVCKYSPNGLVSTQFENNVMPEVSTHATSETDYPIVSAYNEVKSYSYTGNNLQNHEGSWKVLPGLANDIGVGADGSVWVIGTDERVGGHSIFKWLGTEWDMIDGAAERIDVGPDGTVWVVNSYGNIYKRPPGGVWQRLPGLAYDIGVGANGSVYVIGTLPRGDGTDYSIHKWNGSTWDGVDGGAVEISVGPDGTPWVVNSKGNIYRRYSMTAGTND